MVRPKPYRNRLAVAVALMLALAGCGSSDNELTRIGVIGDGPKLVETVNGPLSAGDALIRSNQAQGLVRFDARGQIVPGLAERWNVSDDGLSYIFRLRTEPWPDGRKMRADEVAKMLSRQIRPASKNPLKDALGSVSEIVAMTDRVIEIRLVAPRPNLLTLLAQPEFGLVRAGDGTGPFKPVATAKAGAASGADLPVLLQHRVPVPGGKDIDEKVWIAGGPAHAQIGEFAAGRLELVLGGTFDDLPLTADAKLPRNSLRLDPAMGLFGIRPTSRIPILADPQVRRLISRAIDRQAIIYLLGIGGLNPRATILQGGLEGLGEPPQPDWLSQPPAARRAALAAEANRLLTSNERPTLRIDLPQGPGGELVIQQLARDFEPLGLKIGRAATPAAADLVWVDRVAPSPSAAWFLRRFRCAEATICSPEIDEILEQARTAPDPRQRALLFAQAAQKMDEAQLFIPVAAPIRWSLVARGIDGFIENPLVRHTLVGLKDKRAREDF